MKGFKASVCAKISISTCGDSNVGIPNPARITWLVLFKNSAHVNDWQTRHHTISTGTKGNVYDRQL